MCQSLACVQHVRICVISGGVPENDRWRGSFEMTTISLIPTSFFLAISDGNGEIPAHQGTSWSIARSDGENTMSITSAME